MSKTVLIILGIIVAVTGVLGLVVNGWMGITNPVWYAVAQIVVGLIGIYVGVTDKK